MVKQGFEQRYKIALEEAIELSGLWTNTPIADKIDIEIAALIKGVENGDGEEVTDELLPALIETINYAETTLQEQESING